MNDLQPKPFKVKIQDRTYLCKPPRLSHRLIIGRVQPLFKAMADLEQGKQTDIPAEDLLKYEEDIDVMIQSLIPELKGVTLDIIDLAEILGQIMDHMLPADSKELKDANVDMGKVPSEAKN